MSPESESREPVVVTKPTEAVMEAARRSPWYLGYQAGQRAFAETLVRAVEEIPEWTNEEWRDDELGEPEHRNVYTVETAAVLAAISALRSPADTGEHQEGDVES